MKANKLCVSGLVATLITLCSCSTTNVKYPSDYQDSVFEAVQQFAEDNNLNLVEANKEQYYKGLGTGSSVYSKVVDEIFDKIAEVGANTKVNKEKGSETIKGGKVYEIREDYNPKGSVSLDFEHVPNNPKNNLINRSKDDAMIKFQDEAYEKDYLFYETKLVKELKENYDLPDGFDETKVRKTGYLINTSDVYDDIVTGNYEKWLDKKYYQTERKAYLTAEYIYTNAYASLGSKLAKKLQIIELTDRSDELGSALLLINAYIKEYVEGSKAGQDKDFEVLQRLWKGIPADIAEKYNTDGRYTLDGNLNSKYILSSEEKQFLVDNNLLVVDGEGNTQVAFTLFGEILKDINTLSDGESNPDKIDYELEAKYTGNYTYSVDVGIRKAIDNLIKENFIDKGIFTDTSSIGNLPTDIKTELFKTANVSTRKSDFPKEGDTLPKHGSGTDRTVFQKDGFRYFKNINNGESIVFFDKSSSTYFLIRILDAVDTFALTENNLESIYDTAEKKEQIAREIAYSYAKDGSYNTDSNIYWLRRCNFKYSDNDFLEYMKNNYADLFKTESPYDDYKTLELN